MKKLLIELISLLFILCFCACGTTENTQTEQAKEAPATHLDSYVGGELRTLMDKVTELGYTATYFNQGEDWTEILPLDETMADDFLVGELNENPDAKTVKVDLKPKANAEQEEIAIALEEKLAIGSAWIAAEKYGQDLYGNEFKVHYLAGQISSYAEDADTWSLKATGELNGTDVTCEAKVTGTTESPEVLSINVY